MSVFNIAEQSMIKRANELMSIEGKDVRVAVDGCYQKQRGFNSKNAVVVIASPSTHKVIDVKVKSKYCHDCRGEVIEGYCQCNHKGSSGKMECDGLLELMKTSEDRRNGIR